MQKVAAGKGSSDTFRDTERRCPSSPGNGTLLFTAENEKGQVVRVTVMYADDSPMNLVVDTADGKDKNFRNVHDINLNTEKNKGKIFLSTAFIKKTNIINHSIKNKWKNFEIPI